MSHNIASQSQERYCRGWECCNRSGGAGCLTAEPVWVRDIPEAVTDEQAGVGGYTVEMSVLQNCQPESVTGEILQRASMLQQSQSESRKGTRIAENTEISTPIRKKLLTDLKLKLERSVWNMNVFW